MSTVIFYEKPGCATNARQKLMLAQAGHTVVAKSLLTEPWTGERLQAFFAGTAVAKWFNQASPRVKSGEIDCDAVDAATAISLMLADPLLIRRPLVEADGQRCAGFDREPIPLLLGSRDGQDVQGCSRPNASASCPAPPSLDA